MSQLELLYRPPTHPRAVPPLLFIHGAFAGAWCWDEHFLPYFARHGFRAYAVSLRGHGKSDGHETLAVASMSDFVADVVTAARRIGETPILLGHSMGGMVVQRLLEEYDVPAAVLMASVPHYGLMSSAVGLAMADFVLFSELNLIQNLDTRYASPGGMRRALFSPSMPEEQLRNYSRHMQGESQRAIMEMTVGHWYAPAPAEVPMLVLGAAQDAFFPPTAVLDTGAYHGAETIVIDDLAHAMMLEPRWQVVADAVLAWLERQFPSGHAH